MKELEYKRVKNDINGNPRVVVWFMDLLSDSDKRLPLDVKYNIAKDNAHKIGGKVYRGKDFGGGFVFQCYAINELAEYIAELTK